MLDLPNMIIVGGAGRNVGKTEFACELIRQSAERHSVVAVKVTTIHDVNGCSSCSDFEGDYSLRVLVEDDISTDTGRMLAAGAEKVLWLRVLEDKIESAIDRLVEKLPKGVCIVCESNSARLHIKPSQFVVLKEQGVDTIKPGCQKVIELAGKIIEFYGNGWDLAPGQFEFKAGKWSPHHA